MRATGLGIVASDAFTVEGAPAEAVRICLGGPLPRERLRSALEFMAHTRGGTPAATSTFL